MKAILGSALHPQRKFENFDFTFRRSLASDHGVQASQIFLLDVTVIIFLHLLAYASAPFAASIFPINKKKFLFPFSLYKLESTPACCE
jgi:hypothetical protein